MPEYISSYFTREEVTCGCNCNFDLMSPDTLAVADAIREHLGKPVQCTSGCRCVDHNHSVGGAKRSRHLPRPKIKTEKALHFYADAMDLKVDDPKYVADWLDINFPNVSRIVYETFIHIDTREKTYKRG